MSHTPSDIVNWLRATSNCDAVMKGDALRAADEIERLRADLATLRAALQTQAEEAARLIEQRDELLAALEEAWKFVPFGETETDKLIHASITNATINISKTDTN